MTKKILLSGILGILFYSCFPLTSSPFCQKKGKVRVFLLAGQSNMEGRAKAEYLTNEDKQRLKRAQKNVTLYYNHRAPAPLDVTKVETHIAKKFGAEYLFGPELFFGIEISKKYPNDKIILIKRSMGGRSLYGAWNPDWDAKKAKETKELNKPKLYSDFVDYAHSILDSIGAGNYIIEAMLWVQGESDGPKVANGKATAAYGENLTKLIRRVRLDFGNPELPFILFEVGHKKVVEAMRDVATHLDHVKLIPQTNDKNSPFYFPKNPQPLGHYTYAGQKKLGRLFAQYFLQQRAK